jgi:two-component system, NarL family, sensor kinase
MAHKSLQISNRRTIRNGENQFRTGLLREQFLKLSAWILLLMVCVPAQALFQQPPADSVSSRSNGEILDSLINVSISVIYNNPEKARRIIQDAMPLNEPADTLRMIRAFNILGTSHQLQAAYSKAMEYYVEALHIALNFSDQLQTGHIYNNLGSSNLKLGNHKESLDSYLKALNIYSKLRIDRYRASAHNNIGLLYMELKNYEKARVHYEEALHIRPSEDSIGMAATISNKGTLYLKMGIFDSAFYYHRQSILVDRKTGNKYGLTVGYQGLAEAYHETKQYDKSIENYQNSKSVAQKINHHYQIALADLGLATVYLKMQNPEMAVKYADSAYKIAEEFNNINLQQETHEVYAKIFEHIKDYKNALENYRTSVNLKDSMINQTKIHQIYNLEIEQLSMAGEIQKLEIQRQELLLSKKNDIIIFIVVAFVLTIAGIYLFYLNINHRRKANLQKTILTLTEKKSRAATEAEIQERKRIGQDLHDGLGQMLSVARLNISVLQQKSELTSQRKKELLDAALHSVDEAFYELRNIAHNLAPSVLSSKGLANAIREMADQVNQSKHIKVQLEMYGLNGHLDGILENTLYRAAQELLSNAIKHSGGNNFDMQIIQSEAEITLMAEDDGKGFDINKTLIINGGGLSNIRSRIENLSGSIFIDAKENRGTIISIVIPLKLPDYAGKKH